MAVSVEDQLSNMMQNRMEWADLKKQAEGQLNTINAEIQVFMIQNGYESQRYVNEELGMGMKLVEGSNTTINGKDLITALSQAGLNPDQIKKIMTACTTVKKYTYVDVRAVKKEGEGDEE